ncbi:methyltransferase [Campylobacter iguaniorum]|uniref:class I SAM-dependent methyltransferase n=1 Tax=Campylobacter iguaniorum TaxID=1244531 RepID=UPI00073A1BA5|nr:class I SAM-dependent methyltransferase [Campylobacter iguaniorum]ALV23662.1 methyltransferase [Campylobacter iguaniorum]
MKEEDIRPQKLFDELLRLNKEDIDVYFCNSEYRKISCPACGNMGSFIFNKNGFNFDECEYCKTIYVSPRPDANSFNNYYTDSKSTKFWANEFYKATQDSRREKLWKPKARLIKTFIEKYSPDTKCIIDIGGGYGVFIEEFLKIMSLNHLIIEPSKYLSQICREKNLNVIEKFLEDVDLEDLPKENKTFVSFELFEHLHNPRLFLEILYELLDKNDSFIFTTLSGMGVDIQALQDKSKSVSPPMHLNFFNPKSIKILLEKIGFKCMDILTPGKLDIDIMENNVDKIEDKFWKNFLEYASKEEKDKMQNFISEIGLSSHMMIICKKV